MMIGVLASVLMVLGAMCFDWLDSDSQGTEASISFFWSPDTAGGATFFKSAGLVVLIVAAMTLIATVRRRWGWVMYGAVLAVLAFVLVIVTFYRLGGDPPVEIGDAGPGLWLILAGGILGIVAAVMGRRSPA
jgi:hypothetical protein